MKGNHRTTNYYSLHRSSDNSAPLPFLEKEGEKNTGKGKFVSRGNYRSIPRAINISTKHKSQIDFHSPWESSFPLQRLDQLDRVHGGSCCSGHRHSPTMPLSGLLLWAGWAARLPVAVHRCFTTAHQEDRDTFHERRAATKVDGALSVGADADVDAHAAPAFHSRFRARREAAFPGHPSEIPQVRVSFQNRKDRPARLDPFVPML